MCSPGSYVDRLLPLSTYKTVIVTHHFIQDWLIMQYNFRCSFVNIYQKLLHVTRFITASMMPLSSTSSLCETKLTTSVWFKKVQLLHLRFSKVTQHWWTANSVSSLTLVLWQRHGNRSSAGCSTSSMSVRTLGSVTWSLAYSCKTNDNVTERIMTGRGSMQFYSHTNWFDIRSPVLEEGLIKNMQRQWWANLWRTWFGIRSKVRIL